MSNITKKSKNKIENTVITGLFAAFLCICSVISLPVPFSPAPISLASFGVILCSLLLGIKRSLIAVAVFVFSGALGLPVFSGFQGGAAAVLSPVGGFILGYIPTALITSLTKSIFDKKEKASEAGAYISSFAGLAVLCICGNIGYIFYTSPSDLGGVAACIAACTLPYIIPDIIKAVLAVFICTKIEKLTHSKSKE